MFGRQHCVLAFAAACSALGVAAIEGTAGANGRFPRAERLLEQGGDPERLVLSATYGLLLSNDRGGEWRHLCELGFAFAVDQIDPIVGVFPDGSMLVKGTRSLNHAPPPYCAFEPVLGGVGSDTAVDFSVDHADANRVVALLMLRGDAGTVVNQLYESTDAGRTFTAFGQPLPESDVAFGVTLDAAPSDPERIYVSATGREAPGLLARSDDRGASWTTFELELAVDETPYIAAVHPADADAVFVRTDLWEPNADGIYAANDGLFYTDDGGSSFRELHRAPAKLFGFALSPDGSEILIGYGDPVDPSRVVDPTVLGIYRASTSDFAFTKIYAGAVSCLAWTENGLYVCTSQEERGYALGFAPNATFDLATPDPFTPLLSLPDVNGPLECPACSGGADCFALWSQTCAVFGNCDAAAAMGGSGGTDCQSTGAGEGGATSGRGGERAESPRDASCGCRIGEMNDDRRSFAGVLLAAAAALGRRRTRRGVVSSAR